MALRPCFEWKPVQYAMQGLTQLLSCSNARVPLLFHVILLIKGVKSGARRRGRTRSEKGADKGWFFVQLTYSKQLLSL